jgi:hypothetical protein
LQNGGDSQISLAKSACGKVSRVRHMVPGGSRESRPKRKVRFADKLGTTRESLPSIRIENFFLDLLQLRVFRLSSNEDGDVGIGVFPEREEILVGGTRFDVVA